MICMDNPLLRRGQEEYKSLLNGKVAIILGGGRSSGRAIAVAFASEGARVSVVGPEALRLHHTVHSIQEAGGEGLAIPANLRDLAEVTRLAAETIAQFGRIDILVNVAEGLLGSAFDEGPQLPFQEALHWLFFNGLCLSLEAASYMTRSGGGRIISILGDAEREPGALLATTAINAGLRSLTTELARSLKSHQILVNLINPEVPGSPAGEERLACYEQAGKWPGASARAYELSRQRRRPPEQEEIAAVTLFLASNELVSLTGAEIALYGGRPQRGSP